MSPVAEAAPQTAATQTDAATRPEPPAPEASGEELRAFLKAVTPETAGLFKTWLDERLTDKRKWTWDGLFEAWREEVEGFETEEETAASLEDALEASRRGEWLTGEESVAALRERFEFLR